jgi:predicted ferric reductase
VQKQFGLEPTEGIQRVKAGDFFKVEGPLGHFSPIGSDPREENIWLTTPSELGVFLSFIQSREFQKVRPIKILLIVEVADERELHFREIFEAHHVTVISCVTQPSFWVEGFWGKMTDFLKSKRLRLDFQSSRFFIAANANLSKEIKRVLIEERNVLFSKIECLTEGSVAPVIPLVRKKEGVVNQLKAA